MLIALLFVTLAATAATTPKAPAEAPKPADSQLTREIAAQDAAMFAAFNAHDVAALMAFFTDDLEFYHDKGGLQSHAEVREGFGRLFTNNAGIQRRLVAGTLEVYPVPEYGAIEVGRHQFCHVEHGHDDCGVFQFTMVWQKKDDRWRVTRVLSYGH